MHLTSIEPNRHAVIRTEHQFRLAGPGGMDFGAHIPGVKIAAVIDIQMEIQNFAR